MRRFGIPGPLNFCFHVYELMDPCVHDKVKWQHRGVTYTDPEVSDLSARDLDCGNYSSEVKVRNVYAVIPVLLLASVCVCYLASCYYAYTHIMLYAPFLVIPCEHPAVRTCELPFLAVELIHVDKDSDLSARDLVVVTVAQKVKIRM
ncbi:heat stress transcription factor A-2c-like [Dorcoceras hygrometricum]|uniref:Heat stress transcription factor A-2c-like n=1 Tax=Dorcoceras hygrometricum TaxID=472368 RepID=A0A2Z7C8Z6_9LAMI|nr:heat stress transcription factor A-2c-like [Dorcoceras hygrometricum]